MFGESDKPVDETHLKGVLVATQVELAKWMDRVEDRHLTLLTRRHYAKYSDGQPLTEVETAEVDRLEKVVPRLRAAVTVLAGVPPRYVGEDGDCNADGDVCRGCWEPVYPDDPDRLVLWDRRGIRMEWHQRAECISVGDLAVRFTRGWSETRVIGNTDVEPSRPWPVDVFVQGGSHGAVFGGKCGPYQTAFVEVFPEHTFIRGEGPTVGQAEIAAWVKYQRQVRCPTAPDHGPWEARGRRDGYGWCACGQGRAGVLPVQPADPAAEPTLLEKAFHGDDNAAVQMIAGVVAAKAGVLPEKQEGGK